MPLARSLFPPPLCRLATFSRLIVSTKKRVADWDQAEADIGRLIDLMVRPLTKRD
jgi:hypothetical protein